MRVQPQVGEGDVPVVSDAVCTDLLWELHYVLLGNWTRLVLRYSLDNRFWGN